MTNTFMNKFNEISSLVSSLSKQGAVYKDKHFSVDQEARINLLSVCLGIDKGVDTFPITWITSDGKDLISIENEEEWREVYETIKKALYQLVEFRKQEGLSLEKVFDEKLNNITSYLEEIKKYETERTEKISNRLRDNLQKIDVDFDKNRFEQELIFYIEKLDISEEKTRLTNHLKYFRETMMDEVGQGKKLGFIAQEMGREINTMGSKSNHSEMQILVVKMKDELEQIKEQVLNVL